MEQKRQLTDRETMEAAVRGLTTKSDKIRALDRHGYSRSAIAGFLGIRYQHVRNVLVQSARKTETPPGEARVKIDVGGRIVIPVEFRRAIAAEEGDSVTLRLEGDELRIVSNAASVRRAQALVARYVPKDVSLVDEFLADRRREAAREEDA
jgi:bifunctional DNA-binding transcriptional regulator/antitoxin component of YhaV-PrlF toxin-antitoxin module